MRTLLIVALSGAVLSACAPPCGPETCGGCCDDKGFCQAGSTVTACGVSGAACSSCASGLVCTSGACGMAAGGSAGGTTAGGTTAGGTTAGGTTAGGTTAGGTTAGGTTAGGAAGGTTAGGSAGGFSLLDGGYYLRFCTETGLSNIDLDWRCGSSTDAGVNYAVTSLATSCADPSPGSFFVYEPDAGERCIAEYRARTCSDISTPTCNIGGARGLNEACTFTNTCQSHLFCDRSSTCPGLCRPAIALGVAPDGGNAECVRDAVLVGGVCTRPVPLGGSCAPLGGSTTPQPCLNPGVCDATERCVDLYSGLPGIGQPCRLSYLCALGTQCVNGTCERFRRAFESCDQTRSCQGGLTCTNANLCVPWGQLGSPCRLANECTPGTMCTGFGDGGVCAPPRTEGQTCTSFFDCAQPLQCTGSPSTPGQCVRVLNPGESCTIGSPSSAPCRNNSYCTATMPAMTGLCALKKNAGAPCTRQVECWSNCRTNNTCDAPGNACFFN